VYSEAGDTTSRYGDSDIDIDIDSGYAYAYDVFALCGR
jgi:hypothetical protein